MVEEIWQAVQNNLGHFQREFGSSNIIIIDNSENVNDVFGIIEKEIKKILARPLKNPIGKKWIADNR
jgi:calcineurin-like phosphoesterase